MELRRIAAVLPQGCAAQCATELGTDAIGVDQIIATAQAPAAERPRPSVASVAGVTAALLGFHVCHVAGQSALTLQRQPLDLDPSALVFPQGFPSVDAQMRRAWHCYCKRGKYKLLP